MASRPKKAKYEDSSSDEEVGEIGDPSKGPGEGCTKPIPEDYLQPFYSGWRRELVYRLNTKNGAATQCDVYYIPPQDGRYRTREAKRKRRSKTVSNLILYFLY